MNELLPTNWKIIRLGDHCSVQNGFPFKSESFDPKQGTPLIRVRSLKTQSCDICFNSDYDPTYLVRNGDVVIGMDGDFQPCWWEGGKALLNQRVCRLVNYSSAVEPFYIFQAIKQPLEDIEEATHFTTVKHLSSSKVADIRIALPPLPEQRAIAATLRAVQDAREARRRELDAERERKAALMEDLFTRGLRGELCQQTEIGPLPMSWAVIPLGQVCDIHTGTTPATNRPDYYVGVVPFVKTAEIANNRIWKTEYCIGEQAVKDYNLKLFPRGTVMMAMYGQGKTRGQVALLEVSATTTQNTAAIMPHEQLYSEFLWQWLMSQYDNLRGTGAQGHISHLNLSYVKAYLIPLPPRKEQEELAAVLTACDEKIVALEKEAGLHDELFRALLEELMTGRLSTLPLVEDRP